MTAAPQHIVSVTAAPVFNGSTAALG